MKTDGPETWLHFNTGPQEPAMNMALDEAMLEKVVEFGHPMLRFYGWTAPAATFGYFQPFDQVAEWTPLRPLIRRPTAGGLVPHDADWTYSLAVPPGHPWFELRAEASYQRLHEWVQASFESAGVPAEMAPCCDKTALGRCFTGPEKFDLVHQGVKIAGAAQRRARHGMLIQGSVQPRPEGLARTTWESSMLRTAETFWRLRWEPLDWTTKLLPEASDGLLEKYDSESYNRRR